MAAKGEKRNFTCVWAGVKPTEEELEQIIADHEVWLGNGKERPTNNAPHNMSKSKIEDLDLSEKSLIFGDLCKAYFWEGKLRNANLRGVNLQGASLYKTDLRGSNLQGADLQGANLFHADMKKALLYRANLQETNLQGVDFSEADLFEVNIQGSDLRSANLENTNVTDVTYDRSIKALGVRADSCYGNPLFKRFLQDQDYLEAFQAKHPKIHWLWRVTSDCGRSFGRWALWSFGLIYIFALIYFHGLGEKAFDLTQSSLTFSFEAMLYCSAVIFTALGFGDVKPGCEAAAFWSAVEVALGYIWLGGLVSILANKLARRS